MSRGTTWSSQAAVRLESPQEMGQGNKNTGRNNDGIFPNLMKTINTKIQEVRPKNPKQTKINKTRQTQFMIKLLKTSNKEKALKN